MIITVITVCGRIRCALWLGLHHLMIFHAADIYPTAYPYSDNESIILSVLVKLVEIHVSVENNIGDDFQIIYVPQETLVYCLSGVTIEIDWSLEAMDYIPVLEDGKALIRLHNVPPEQHLTATIPFQSQHYDIKFCKRKNAKVIIHNSRVSLLLYIIIASYTVQNVTVSDDHKILHCQFLKGTAQETCFIFVYHNNKPLSQHSDSNAYNLHATAPGTYDVKVYDNEQQSSRDIQPAVNITFGELYNNLCMYSCM